MFVLEPFGEGYYTVEVLTSGVGSIGKAYGRAETSGVEIDY